MSDDEIQWEKREYGTHSPESASHYKEQMGAEAIDELKKMVADKDTYGVYLVSLSMERSQTAAFVWAGPSEHPLHLLSVAEDFDKMAHDAMKRDVEEKLKGSPELMNFLREIGIIPKEDDDE